MTKRWVIRPIREEAGPAEREFLTALRAIALLAGESLTAVAAKLYVHPSTVTRHLRERSGNWGVFPERLFKAAEEACEGGNVGITLAELRKLFDAAVLAEPRFKNELRQAYEASIGAVADKDGSPAHLPVPRTAGDRQVNASGVPSAQQFADRAAELLAQGLPDAALAAMREATEALTAAESAAALILLRAEDQTELAETFLHIFGRQQPDKEVMRMALGLIVEYDSPHDAGAVLKAALDRAVEVN
ncbi:hypothetical protein [Streptomyces daliensis]|uniref:Helix-turn-helix domain-containing protein n=1 Tax=Streptomyces daliensis TaxID=299421 RepID=A0A8T4IMZ4_9ACTN|nr:helix-turn-helix domain-containing protein [Streptomyces daliensis]